ncbi:MAG: hypothetical protein MK180_08530 [Rhodobacteraceae bacterium]|nr:hypothetical protein [Paracoccaceae bacterium]
MADPRKSELTEAELDRLFKASDAETPLPSGDLMARIMADAEAVQAQAIAPTPGAAPQSRGLFAGLGEALGGWAGLSGLGAAVATGLVIGIFPPDQLASYAAMLTGAEVSLSDYVPGDMALSTVASDG